MRKRLTRKIKNKRKKQVIIISTICLLLVMVSGYAAFQTNLTITAKGNIKEKSRVIQAWDDTSQTDFHSDFYKQNIVSATFLDNATVPSNATESWNISEDKANGGVKAWVVPNNEDSTKYDLYIGAKDGVIANEISYGLFYNFTAIKSINFNNNFDTSNTTNMAGMFAMSSNLISLDLSNFNTANVTNMQSMFDGCSSLTDLNISNFNTSNVTTMKWMFAHVPATSLNVSSFDTSKVTDMNGMFLDCSNLENLDLSHFNTSNVTTIQDMFRDCTSLTSINLNNWNTSNVTNMLQTFRGCTGLTVLNLCSFDTGKVTDFTGMFYYIFNLDKVKVGPNWTTAKADTTNMFENSGISKVTTGEC